MRVNSQTGGELGWIVHNSFEKPPDGGPSPFENTLRALSPILKRMAGRKDIWRQWAGNDKDRPLAPFLKSMRQWIRARPDGLPHLLRLRGLIDTVSALPAPDGGDGRLIDRAVKIGCKAHESGLGRTMVDVLGLLEKKGYLDRQLPRILKWMDENSKQESQGR